MVRWRGADLLCVTPASATLIPDLAKPRSRSSVPTRTRTGDDMQNRAHPRVTILERCELAIEGMKTEGKVLDASEGGLSVLSPLSVEQGASVHVTLGGPDGEPLVVQTLAWHNRRMSSRKAGGVAYRLGLVVTDPSDAYLEFVEAGGRVETPQPDPSETAEPVADLAPPETAEATRRYSVRMGQTGCSRSRSCIVSAPSAEEAEAVTLEEMGDGWKVLDVRPV